LIPEMFCCCKEQSSWIFVYPNNLIYGVCDKHFKSPSHQYKVKYAINIESGKKLPADRAFRAIEVAS